MPDEPVIDGVPDTPAPEAGAGTEAAQPDPVMARLDELGGRLDTITEAFQQQPQPDLSQQYAGDGQPYYDEPGQGGFDPGFEPQQPQQDPADALGLDPQDPVVQLYQQNQQLLQRLDGLENTVKEDRRLDRAAQLEERYEDFRDQAKVAGILETAQREASALAQMTGDRSLLGLAVEPAFIEKVYLAERARELAQQETPAGAETGVELEASGAASLGSQEQDDTADRIVQAYGQNPFA